MLLCFCDLLVCDMRGPRAKQAGVLPVLLLLEVLLCFGFAKAACC
jgi:hypothetical protein